jgi:hypothetical protein
MIELMHYIEAEDLAATADGDPSRVRRIAFRAEVVRRESELAATVALLDHQAAGAGTVEELAHVGGDSRNGFADFGHRSGAYI